MRGPIPTIVAVVVSSALAFVAGARSGLSLGSRDAAAECAPVSAPPVETAIAATAEPSAAPATPPPDEGEWPYKKWVADEDEQGDRLYSKVRFLWIRPEPRSTDLWLGYLSLGDSVRVKGGSKDAAYVGKGNVTGCESWYAVEPRGYVCVDPDDATFDPDDPTVVELRRTRGDRFSAFPYQYGESTGTPVYVTIPPVHVQRQSESTLEEHLRQVREARRVKTEEEKIAIAEELAGVDVQLTEREAPSLVPLGPRGRTGKDHVVRTSTIAFVDSFDADDRSWVLTWDRGIVPRDRVKLYPKSEFHGVPLGEEVKLPIGFFRKRHEKFKPTDDGGVAPTGEYWESHGFVQLTGNSIEHDGKRYLITRENGLLTSVDDLSVARRSHSIPPKIQSTTEGRRTWVDVSVLGGWLVAYEYDKPVYATMVSAGRGGVPKENVDPLVTASTPVGRHRITGKFVTATMISNASREIIHDEVMYTQNFTGPYALHGAYWHDEFGYPKSGGCVNLSPIDARRIFSWSDPQLPAGWHAVQLVTGYEGALGEYENATLVYTHK
jgi:L,D-transpeptidase-like protein